MASYLSVATTICDGAESCSKLNHEHLMNNQTDHLSLSYFDRRFHPLDDYTFPYKHYYLSAACLPCSSLLQLTEARLAALAMAASTKASLSSFDADLTRLKVVQVNKDCL